MKKIVVIAIMLCVSITIAQEEKNVTYIEKGDLTEATYYYDNGAIKQVGTFNAEGKLDGEWISYDINGDKTTVANYVNGKKSGKWQFWNNDGVVREVTYENSRIVSVNERTTAY